MSTAVRGSMVPTILSLTAPTGCLEERETIRISRVGKGKGGFSLLELLVVLLLLGLSSLLVLPAMDRALEKQAVRRSTVEIAAVARDLRGRAIYKGILQELLVSSSEGSYQGLSGKKFFLPPAVKISEIVGGELVGEDKRRFVFFPNGSILGGEIAISGREVSASYTIRLDPLSGRVLVVRETAR
ncbi:MAG: prepilin-type N-terminal cleavage/methylation domain-containing protein [Candidatus Binatia bacterium]